jgi:hypothetical protein
MREGSEKSEDGKREREQRREWGDSKEEKGEWND